MPPLDNSPATPPPGLVHDRNKSVHRHVSKPRRPWTGRTSLLTSFRMAKVVEPKRAREGRSW
jgi:hypothetical protein